MNQSYSGHLRQMKIIYGLLWTCLGFVFQLSQENGNLMWACGNLPQGDSFQKEEEERKNLDARPPVIFGIVGLKVLYDSTWNITG